MDNKSRDIFYGVVAVATLIVALVGATLAYFSIATGSGEGSVSAKAATVSIEYNDGQQVTAAADKLIPSTLDVVKTIYERKSADFGSEAASRANICTDVNNKQVCSVYRFSIKSDAERTITATLNSESNGFTYLAYAVRDVTNNTWLTLDNNADGAVQYIALSACGDEGSECFTLDSSNVKTYSTNPQAIYSIFGYDSESKNVTKTVGTTEQVYDLVLFLNENNKPQNIDQGKEYTGTIIVEATDNTDSIITGKAN